MSKLASLVRQAKMGTETAIQIIETVENRCMAADGPVTPTRQEITDQELRDIWDALVLADSNLSKARAVVDSEALQK